MQKFSVRVSIAANFPRNPYTSKKMKIKKMLTAKCGVLALIAIFSGFSVKSFAERPVNTNRNFLFSVSVKNFADTEMEIFDSVNKVRARKALRELRWNYELSKLARDYSGKMARGGFFDHFDPEGATVVERAKDAHIKKWSKIGENLFLCEPTNDLSYFAIKGWMESPTHKENILDRAWTDSGIGIAQSRNGDIYVTQVFIEK
jgi:uncharacterized protein YkwD